MGLIGGLSWESSLVYYKLINEMVKQRLGGLHSAQCTMYSVDFGPIEAMMREENWTQIREILADAAVKVEKGGADLIAICSNTMNKMADDIQSKVSIPVLHIADATAAKIKSSGMKKVGLLGTKAVMEGDFYKERLKTKHNIDVVIPTEADRVLIHEVILTELCLGILNPVSRERFKEIMNKLVSQGAEGIVLGCTEIPLLIKQDDSDRPVFDTLTIHAEAIVEAALR